MILPPSFWQKLRWNVAGGGMAAALPSRRYGATDGKAKGRATGAEADDVEKFDGPAA